MAYIFMDESGDLGFDKQGSSKYFVVTFLFQNDQKTSDSVIKNLFHRLKGKKVKIRSGVFHCCKESEENIQKALTLIKDKKLSCMALILNKGKVYTRLQNEKHILYNWVVNLLINVLVTKNILPQDEKIFFIASRREPNKTLNENFISYLSSQNKDKLDIEFIIKTPYQDKGLQVVDILSYAIYQKYEKGNSKLYSIIEKLIIEEKFLFE